MSRREFDLFPAAKAGPAPAHRAEAPASASVGTPARSRAAMLPGGNSDSLAAVLARTGGGRLKDAGSALLQLQRGYGNRYVQRVVDQARTAPVSQARLLLGPADDRYEREADRVAQAVVGGATPTVNRATNHPSAIQRLGGAAGGPVAAGVQQAIQGARGSGQQLPERVRGPLERAFGADFARVRLHTDVQADQLSRALQAQAFTTGRDIFFRRGEYDADSTRGQHTLAHELTHVVQQRDRPMVVQCLRRRGATLRVNANLRQDGELIQRVLFGTRITIDLDSVETSPEGNRSYQLMKVNGEDVSDQGWWLWREWFDLLPRKRKRRTEKEKASSPSRTGFILSPDLFQGGSEQASQRPRSKYVHNLVVQFGSPGSQLDEKIRGGSWNLVAKLNSLAPYKLTKEQKAGLPRFENAKVISVERKSPDDPFDPRAVEDVTNALRTLRAASKFGSTRLYLRGHGDPQTKTLGGWSAQAVWSFLSECGIEGMKIDVISVTGCQLALRPDEMMKKMGPEWLEARGKTVLTDKEAQLYRSRYYKRGEQVYQQPGPAGPEEAESFPAVLTGIMSGSLANNPAVLGRTEYVDVASQAEWRGTKATSYAAYGSFSGLERKGPYTKREYRWDPNLKKVVWNWLY
jgi:Domain of unknown function (DUF4157)